MLVNETAAAIAANMPEGTLLHVADQSYKMMNYQSHLGKVKVLAVQEGKQWSAFTDDEYYPIANRESYLAFANNTPLILQACEDRQEEVIQALQQAFINLRKAAKIE